MQRYITDEDFALAKEIPEMAKLTRQQQLFVWEWTHNGCNTPKAAAAAGYTQPNGYYLLKRQDIITAITALTDRMLHGLALPAIVALEAIVSDPFHKDRLKAAAMILNRTGWPEVQEHRVKVEKVPDEQAMVRAAYELAQRMGIDPLQLIGSNTPLIELHAEPELPPPLPDGSDI